MRGVPGTCRRCSTPVARADVWYCDACRTPGTDRPTKRHYLSKPVTPPTPTTTGDQRNATGDAIPTETDIPRLLDIAARLGVPVFHSDQHGNLVRRTKEN